MRSNKLILGTINLFLVLVMCISTYTGILVPQLNDDIPVAFAVSDSSTKKIDSDAWAAVDGLGRTLPSYSEAKASVDRTVGIFYWTWHYSFSHLKPLNINSIIEQYPEAKNDYNHDIWKKNRNVQNFWNESIYGHYRSDDKYVLRKHAELLADAGVDVMIFDCTNGDDSNNTAENRRRTWPDGYRALFETLKEAKEDGVNVPKVAFMLPFGASNGAKQMLKILYEDIYSKGYYKDLWFYWDGKPLIMAHINALDYKSEHESEIMNFFTFKKNDPSYFSSDMFNMWGWASIYPQPKYGDIGADGRPEQMTVSVAQNANIATRSLTAMNGKNVMGRGQSIGDYSYSYVYKGEKVTVSSDTENAHYYGINLQQQFDYAIKCDPEFMFITGWNEWIMGRYDVWPPVSAVGAENSVKNAFPDQYNDEYSRDIEPSKGELKDYYYYQLVANIRRYKGMDNVVPQMSAAAIDMNNISSWDKVSSSYDHYTDSTYDRDMNGFRGTHYENNTMRNDIVHTKFAYDNDNVYFYVETEDNISPYTDKAWMRLLIDTDKSGKSPNWEGFEYIINRISPDADKCTLEVSKGTDKSGNWLWETVGKVDYKVSGKILQIAVPRKLIGLSGNKINFNFKWSDNMQEDGNILDFYTNGDVAPGGRFMFTATTNKIENVPSLRDDGMGSIIGDGTSTENSGNSGSTEIFGNPEILGDDAADIDKPAENDSASGSTTENNSMTEDLILIGSVCVVTIGLIIIILFSALIYKHKKMLKENESIESSENSQK